MRAALNPTMTGVRIIRAIAKEPVVVIGTATTLLLQWLLPPHQAVMGVARGVDGRTVHPGHRVRVIHVRRHKPDVAIVQEAGSMLDVVAT